MRGGSIDIFDSNVWIRAFTNSHPRAVSLRNEVKQGQRRVRVNAYIYQEVFDAFDKSHQHQASQLKSAFAQFISHCNDVEDPAQRAVSRMKCARVRDRTEMQLIGDVLDIQTKDAPVVVLARDCHKRDPTIYTHDHGFGQLSPQQHGIGGWLTMNHIQ